jgi:hypothetical protein
MMTKIHFENVARVLATVEDMETRADLVAKFAQMFEGENPKFDFERFAARVRELTAQKA